MVWNGAAKAEKSKPKFHDVVPCCGGLELAAKKALRQSGKFIPWQVVTVTVDGRLVEE